jgi:hypothetical protein
MLSSALECSVAVLHAMGRDEAAAVLAGALVVPATLLVGKRDGDVTAGPSSPSTSPRTVVDDRPASPHPDPAWYPTDGATPGTPPYAIAVRSPVDRADVGGPCLRITGTGSPPADTTLIVADRNIDGPPGQPFIYTQVGWDGPGTSGGWHTEIALGSAPWQRYELAVLVAGRAAVHDAWAAATGLVTSTTFIPGLRLAVLLRVRQTSADGPPCGD